jgi:hypothetical protein
LSYEDCSRARAAFGNRGKPERGRGTQIVVKRLSARVQLSRDVQMATAAQEYRNKAATCLRLSKTMDEDNKQRLEEIARWLELAEQEEQGDEGYFEAAESGRCSPAPRHCL